MRTVENIVINTSTQIYLEFSTRVGGNSRSIKVLKKAGVVHHIQLQLNTMFFVVAKNKVNLDICHNLKTCHC